MKRYHYFESKNETLEIDAKINKTNHSYFSLTGTWYSGNRISTLEGGGKVSDKYYLSGGAIGKEIVALFPEFELLEKMHLADSETGRPMYTIENGFYYFQIAIGTASHHNKGENDYQEWSQVLADHLRISLGDCLMLIDRLKNLPEHEQKYRFAEFCITLEPRWKKEAEQVKEQFNL